MLVAVGNIRHLVVVGDKYCYGGLLPWGGGRLVDRGAAAAAAAAAEGQGLPEGGR
jgi:hypothetical protein